MVLAWWGWGGMVGCGVEVGVGEGGVRSGRVEELYGWGSAWWVVGGGWWGSGMG